MPNSRPLFPPTGRHHAATITTAALSSGSGLKPRRRVEPAFEISSLPKFTVVVEIRTAKQSGAYACRKGSNHLRGKRRDQIRCGVPRWFRTAVDALVLTIRLCSAI